jgi:hypothetical protein
MKPEKMSLPAAVIIIGLIYAVALTAAPESGPSAPAGSAQTVGTGAVEYRTAAVVAGLA